MKIELGPRWQKVSIYRAAIVSGLLLGVVVALFDGQDQNPANQSASVTIPDVARIDTAVAAAVVPGRLSHDPALGEIPTLSFTGTYEPREWSIDAAEEGPSPAQLAALPLAREEVVKVRRGDTLLGLLSDFGVERDEARAAVASLGDVFDPRRLQPGQEIRLALHNRKGRRGPQITGFSFQPDVRRRVVVNRDDDGRFFARSVDRDLKMTYALAEGTIQSSLSEAAAEADVPPIILSEMIRALSFDVDFQRDLKKGDTFELLFERYTDESGLQIQTGNILYAELNLSGKPLRFYRHETADGRSDFFNENGVSIRRSLMRTPIDGAWISSNFGMRKHPILGYNKMHRGTDFAAPIGTPIYAAGDGVVEVAGWNGGYGKYVRIRHNSTYKTAYAHMKRFARGVTKGARVSQGQVIGYVGSTGRSTGPHLHYEVLVNNQQVNPRRIKLPTGRILKGEELLAFRDRRGQINDLRLDQTPAFIAGYACEGPDTNDHPGLADAC